MASKGYVELLDKLELTANEKENFEKILEVAKPDVHILVAGKTGTGKSKLVNALTGAIVAREGHSIDPETASVEKYEAMFEDGYTVNVWDCPGFLDGSGKDRDYVHNVKAQCWGKIDILLYCIDMSDTRAHVDEMSLGMKLLTDALGQDAWSHAMIILTFANVVAERFAEECSDEEAVKRMFLTRVAEWKEKVCFALDHAGVQPKISSQIPVEPAGDYLTPHLPDRIHWLGYLWLQFFFHIKDEAKLAILVTNENRLRNSECLQPKDLDTLIDETEDTSQLPLVVDLRKLWADICGDIGAVLCAAFIPVAGTALGVAMGTLVGLGIGTVYGLLVVKILQKRRDKKGAKKLK